MVVSQHSTAVVPGTKSRFVCRGEEGIFANKTQAAVWPTGPQRLVINWLFHASPSGGIGALYPPLGA